MSAAAPVATLMATMREFYRVLAAGSPGNHAIERDGVTAFVAASAPTQSIVNGVMADGPEALARGYDELAQTYASAGVTHWMVWTLPGERRVPELLGAAGHLLEYEPEAMALALDALRPPPPSLLEADFALDRDADPAVIAALNAAAYGLPDDAFGAAFDGLADARFHRYVATVDGEPAACAVTFDHAGDCMVNWVATAPHRQRRGLSRRLLHGALRDARERGARTSTLQASHEGRPLYARLGYVALGPLGMWVNGDAPQPAARALGPAEP